MTSVIGSETTPTIGAVFISEHFSKEAQLATRKEQVLAGTMDTRYEAEMSSGRVLHIAHVLNQSVTTKSANVVVVPDANTPTNQDITVSGYVYSATHWESIVQVQADIVNVEDIAGQMGYALQGQIETDAAGLPDGLGTNTVGTFGQELTMDDWESVWQKMQTGLAPKNDRFLWLSSACVSSIRKLQLPISADFTKSNIAALDNATLGMFLGFKVVESQYLESPATGQHDNGAHHRSQYILIQQTSPRIERERVLGDISTLVVGWMVYITAEREIIAEAAGAESLTDQYGVWIKSV